MHLDVQIATSRFLGNDTALVTEVIEQRRVFNAQRLLEATGGVVQHGLLKGYRLRPPFAWGAGDVGGQLLGLYEQEVAAVLAHLCGSRDTLIDLGAANGYYGVGLVATRRFSRSICFEISDMARTLLHENAQYCGVAAEVSIHGAATPEFVEEAVSSGADLSRSVVLVDIEGAEFEILSKDVLHRLRDAYVIIENHDFMMPQRYELSAALMARAEGIFHVAEMKVGARDLRSLPLVDDHWTDNDRWLLCSESRAKLASWLLFSPRHAEPLTGQRLEAILAEYRQRQW